MQSNQWILSKNRESHIPSFYIATAEQFATFSEGSICTLAPANIRLVLWLLSQHLIYLLPTTLQINFKIQSGLHLNSYMICRIKIGASGSFATRSLEQFNLFINWLNLHRRQINLNFHVAREKCTFELSYNRFACGFAITTFDNRFFFQFKTQIYNRFAGNFKMNRKKFTEQIVQVNSQLNANGWITEYWIKRMNSFECIACLQSRCLRLFTADR